MRLSMDYPTNQLENARTVGLLRYLVQKTHNNLAKNTNYKSRVLCSILTKVYALTHADLMDKHVDLQFLKSVINSNIKQKYDLLPYDVLLGESTRLINLSELNHISLSTEIYYLQDGKQITVEKLPLLYVVEVNKLLEEYHTIRKMPNLSSKQGYEIFGYTEDYDLVY